MLSSRVRFKNVAHRIGEEIVSSFNALCRRLKIIYHPLAARQMADGFAAFNLEYVWYTTLVKCTRYFEEQVLRKRSYLKLVWIRRALSHPEKKIVQDDGRIRYWIFVKELDKYLRVVTLEDGKTVHNAFPDRNFRKEDI